MKYKIIEKIHETKRNIDDLKHYAWRLSEALELIPDGIENKAALRELLKEAAAETITAEIELEQYKAAYLDTFRNVKKATNRAVLLLFSFGGLSTEEIAALLNITEARVREGLVDAHMEASQRLACGKKEQETPEAAEAKEAPQEAGQARQQNPTEQTQPGQNEQAGIKG